MARLAVRRFGCRDEAESYYLAQVDTAAERARRLGPAQEAVYQRKLAEAAQGDGPLIAAEAAALGEEVAVVAQRVIEARAAWEAQAAAVEVARIRAKTHIRQAATTADMQAIAQAFAAELHP